MKVLFIPRSHIWPSLTNEQIDAMKKAGATEVIQAEDREEQYKAIFDADVLIGPIDPELFERAGRLVWVQALSSGVDALLFRDFVESDITLTSEKGLVGPHLADHAFALLLSLTRSILWAGRQRRWENRMEMRRVNTELTGKTAGLIGFGSTGTEVARRASAFGMRAIAVDPVVTDTKGLVEWLGEPERLREMARQSDVLVVCCPLTAETRNIVDAEVIGAMPEGSFVINVTRGGIIDEEALADAIQSGHLAGAGLDVAAEEPLPDTSRLWKFDNVIITPHTAGASQHRIPRIQDRVIKNIENMANGRTLEGIIDKRKGY